MQRRLLLVGTVVLLALAAGCTGSDGGGGGSGGADWCGSGTIQGVASQQAGGEFSVDVQGTTERDGREVCHVSYEFEGGSSEYARMEAFFDEGQEYFELIYYDAEGNVVGSLDMSGAVGSADGSSGDAGTDGDGSDGSGGSAPTGESTSWCQAGQTATASDPQQGSQTTFSVQGMVDRDGRQLCLATFEITGEDAAYSRIEMYYDEDDSYQEMVYYDAEGNVVYEFTVNDGA